MVEALEKTTTTTLGGSDKSVTEQARQLFCRGYIIEALKLLENSIG